ncbi:MAG: cob(I)yrinic acid a,c-diamide adenosyltransferase [Candidatus Micrarchaeota archaeon]|nr:cob(I)yrinic acid a,c-diamide adenosyltransferase [Candidatus Micrarchaeota archaeon]
MQRKEGLVHVLTGDGNGKTTSAIGIATRAAGRGLRVAFIQFLKGGLSGELASLEKLGITVITGTKHCPNFAKHTAMLKEKGHIIFCKDCFVINEHDKPLVNAAFVQAQEFTSSGKYELVILDEIFWAILEKLVSEDQLMSLIENRHASCELILTGRGATQKIESASDYVTYVNKIKHPFDKGILSRPGIDY